MTPNPDKLIEMMERRVRLRRRDSIAAFDNWAECGKSYALYYSALKKQGAFQEARRALAAVKQWKKGKK